jgi:hypothetical protein
MAASTSRAAVSRYREAKLQKMTARAMETLPGLFLGLSTGALGDSDEPIVLDGAGAGPSGSGHDRNLEPPTDSDDDSDLEELTRDQYILNLSPPPPPQQRVQTTWARPDREERARLIAASTTTASDAAAHDRSAQLAFIVSLARDAYLAARPGATWDDENPSFLLNSPLQGFYRLFVRVEQEGLRDGEVVLERRTEGRVSGLAMYAAAGRRGETMLQLLGFGSRAGLGGHLHEELLRDVRRRYAPPITLRLTVPNCVSQLAWFYQKHLWRGDGSPGGQLTLTLE